ncbi:MAG: ATP-binding cassette domain-containing protein [Geminicoccaceae bacterium]
MPAGRQAAARGRLTGGSHPGDTALQGANGGGQSSLLRLLAGFLIPPAAGSCMAAGMPSPIARYRAALHHLGYQDALKPGLTVAENLEATAALLGGDPGRLAPALETFALGGLAATPVRFLSSGQRRRGAGSSLSPSRSGCSTSPASASTGAIATPSRR